MRAEDPTEHLVGESRAVVRAEQRAACPGAGRESEVEQVLVALALVDLGGVATGPDRFADAPSRAAGLGGEKVAPEGNNPSRVAPDLLDRDEIHPLGARAKLGPEQLGV